MNLVAEYIFEISDYCQQHSLNFHIELHTNIRGRRNWIVTIEDPTGLLSNWKFRSCGESLQQTLKEVKEKVPTTLFPMPPK